MATKQKNKPGAKPTAPANRGTEIIESSEALAEQISKTEEFIKKNSLLVYGILAAVLLGVAGILGFRYYKESQNTKAMEEMFQAQFYFEQDSLSLALNGDGNNFGFIDIIDIYGGTAASNLAHYYAGVINLKQGNFDEAIDHLTDYSSSDLLVQSRAYALTGDAYMEKEEYGKAASYYDKAADRKPTEEFTPGYLMKAGLAYELAGDVKTAKARYDEVLEDYPNSPESSTAKREQMRMAGMM